MNQPAPNEVFLGFPASSPAGKSIAAGREVPPDFPREWFEFVHPEDPLHSFTIDLTWVESTWSCRFGTPECLGMHEEIREVGCCNHGAYMADEQDRDDLYNAVAELPAKYWQLRPKDTDSFLANGDITELEPWLEWDEEDNMKTKVVDGGCIFANRNGHPTGPGCALHQYAMAAGKNIVGSKPEVCWQVPFSREDAYEERPDGQEILRTTIGEYDRRQWGSGGEDFDWWCSGAPSCHAPRNDADAIPVWRSMKAELIALIGEAPYEVLAAHCEARGLAPDVAKQKHPAATQASNL